MTRSIDLLISGLTRPVITAAPSEITYLKFPSLRSVESVVLCVLTPTAISAACTWLVITGTTAMDNTVVKESIAR